MRVYQGVKNCFLIDHLKIFTSVPLRISNEKPRHHTGNRSSPQSGRDRRGRQKTHWLKLEASHDGIHLENHRT
jgi:hypothetical protein